MKSNIFRPTKIKGKLLLAFSAVLFLSSILAGWGYYSINRVLEIRGVEESFKNISMIVLKMRKAEKDFLMRDIVNTDFMTTGKSKYVGEIKTYLHQDDSLISTLLESSWSEKLGIDQDLASLQTSLNEYQVTFDKINAAYRQRGFMD